MSLWATMRVIWAKELVETLRDRKTIVMMIVVPLLMYPLIFLALGQATAMQVESMRTSEVAIGVTKDVPGPVRDALTKAEFTTLLEVADGDELTKRVRSGELGGGIMLAPSPPVRTSVDGEAAGSTNLKGANTDDGPRPAFSDGGTLPLRLVFDGGSDLSRNAEGRIREGLKEFERDELNRRLKAIGRPLSYVDPVSINADNIAPPTRQGGYFLGQILPMLISVLMIGAAFYPAIDLTAGEKERGTLQTLLTAPITPIAIVGGKYLAVVTLTLITGVMNLASMAFVALAIPMPAEVAAEFSLDFGLDVVLLMLVALVLMGMMFGAVMMAIAVTAKSFKEAQNYLTPIYLLCIFPLLISGLPGVQLTEVSAALPIINLALAIKSLLVDGAASPLLGIVFISTACWIALALVLAARVFRNESVLLGDAGISALFARRTGSFGSRPSVPTIGEMVVLLGVTLLGIFYGSVLLQGASLLAIIHTTQWVLLLLPAVAMVLVLKLDTTATFRLRRAPAWAWVAAFAGGAGTWAAAQLLLHALFQTDVLPVPTSAMEEFQAQLAALASEPGSALMLFAGVALAPAICEEALFRGVVLSALSRRLSARWAITIQAILFGVYHLNIYQALPATAVGLLLGAIALRSRSIWPGVLLHALHNGLAVAVQFYILDDAPAAATGDAFPLWFLALLLGPVVAIILVARAKPSTSEPEAQTQ